MKQIVEETVTGFIFILCAIGFFGGVWWIWENFTELIIGIGVGILIIVIIGFILWYCRIIGKDLLGR